MKKFRYTTEQIEFLKIGYLSMNAHDLTKAFNKHFDINKTEVQIKSALQNHRILCGRAHKDRLVIRYCLFTLDHVKFLRNNYKGRSIAEMTVVFNAEFDTDMTRQQIKTVVKNRGITSGRTGCFPKGRISWNKGTKSLTIANKTSFKKGNVPANRKQLDSERICPKDGYILIKVAERNSHTGFPTRWKHKHVHIWEQDHGPVPDGMVVAFRDGDKRNIDPENLMLILRAELLRLNQYNYKDTPAKLKPSILALVKLEVKIFDKIKTTGYDRQRS